MQLENTSVCPFFPDSLLVYLVIQRSQQVRNTLNVLDYFTIQNVLSLEKSKSLKEGSEHDSSEK